MDDDPLLGFVVFHDNGAWWFSRWQRPGYRHCFVVVVSGEFLLCLDGTDGTIDISSVGRAADFDKLMDIYVSMRWEVVPFRSVRAPVKWPMCWATCVGMTKIVLGLNKPFIVTPWRLFRHLTKQLDLPVYTPHSDRDSMPANETDPEDTP